MNAITSCRGCITECFLMVLVVTGLSIFSPVWCQICNTVKGEPQINISSIPPSNKLSIGASIYLTCNAWKNEPGIYLRPSEIEWFDPQDKSIRTCKAISTQASFMNCTLEVGNLTDGNLGNYTCKASNVYGSCNTKRFQVDRQQGGPHINISSSLSSNKLSIGAAINLTCTAWQTNELANDSKTRPHLIEWFDPQGKRIGGPCQAERPPAKLLKCPLKVDALTDGKLGSYTCRARNNYNYCSTKRFQVHRQQDEGNQSRDAGSSTTNKKSKVKTVEISVALSVGIMFLGAFSVFLQRFRGRCPRNQTYNNTNHEKAVTEEEDQLEAIYDYIDNSPLLITPQEHDEVLLSFHNSGEQHLLSTSGAERPVKKPPLARPLPPTPHIEKEGQRMEENLEDNVKCLRMLHSESQNPNSQTPDKGRRANILEGQGIPLDIEKNTGLIAVLQETGKKPWLLPSGGSMSETVAETKLMLSVLDVDTSPGEPPKVREMLSTPDFEAASPGPPKPTRETEKDTKYNESSSINSQEIEEDYEIDLKRLEVQDEVLGEGEFGIVYKGRYHGKDTRVIDVAVKQLKDTADNNDKAALLSEIQMLKQAGKHPNIVNLVGACTQGENILLVTDLIPGGTLESFLTSKPALGEHGKYENFKCALNDRELIKIALQIASAMQHLESKKCIHGDVAARNVFIDKNNKVAKLGDFGMARDISDRGIYNKTSNGRVPWRWLSIESLRYGVYTSQSDVWSFGILLWEIATFGEVPYPDIATPWALKSFLSSGRRMPRPHHCTEELYALMQSCWMENPLMRPTFQDIAKKIRYFLRKVKKSYMNVQDDDITDDSETF